MGEGRRVHVHFALQQEDGWPPFHIEELDATRLDTQRAVVTRPPSFVPGLAVGNVVEVSERDGQLWDRRVVAQSNNSTLRLMGRHGHTVRLAEDVAVRHGCQVFATQLEGLSVVDVPPAVDYRPLEHDLRQHDGDWWEYEEACLSALHRQQLS